MAKHMDRPAFSASELTFYANAKARAKALGVSQRTIAAKLHLSEAFVSEFMNFKNRLSTNRFDELAIVLQTSVSDLFAPLPTVAKKGASTTNDVTLPDTPAGVGSALPNEGVSVYAVSVQADPLQFKAELQQSYDEVNAAISTLIDTRGRLSRLLGRADDREQSAGVELPQARVGGSPERRNRATVSGREKDAPVRRTGVR